MVVLAGLASCPAPQKVDIDVVFKAEEPVYVRMLDTAALARLKGTPHKNRNIKTLGLTIGNMKYSFQGHFSHRTDRGSACMTITKMSMRLTYVPKIYLASDYRQSGCSADTIIRHEKKHVATDLKVAKDFVPRLTREIRKAASAIGFVGPFPARLIESEQNRLTKKIVSALKTIQQSFVAERDSRQAEIDLPKNLLRDLAPCRGRK